MRDVHLQGPGPAKQSGIDLRRLLQALDNAANERLEYAHRVKIFEKLKKKIFGTIGTNCHLAAISRIVSNKMFS